MALSAKTRRILTVSMANTNASKELADAVDAGINGLGATGPTGAVGPTGPQGIQGIAGPQGPTGTPGSASAYSAGNTGDWSGSAPITIAAALDRIAAAIAAGTTGPIA